MSIHHYRTSTTLQIKTEYFFCSVGDTAIANVIKGRWLEKPLPNI